MTVTIPLKAEFIPAVIDRRKRTTIRAGNRAFPTGPAEIVSGNTRIPISITQVTTRAFTSLDTSDALSDGFESLDALKDALVRFYPSLHGNDPVTIVQFELLCPNTEGHT